MRLRLTSLLLPALLVASSATAQDNSERISRLNTRIDSLTYIRDSLLRVESGNDSAAFQLVEIQASFKGGGPNEFTKWVNNNLEYPAECKEKGIQGRVTAQFTVTAEGDVTGVKVLRGVHPLLDAEAVRVLSLSPKWEPGKMRGKPVRVTYTFPVIFQLRQSSNRRHK